MAIPSDHGKLLLYAKSARRDWRMWLLLVVGLFFAWVGSVADPANCDSSGDCAPWLVPLLQAIGLLSALVGLVMLLRNPHRGSYLDGVTDDLVWWSHDAAQVTRHPLADISRIRIDLGSDSDDIHIYDLHGERIAFPGPENAPWPFQDWAQRVSALYPHIQTDVRSH